MKLTNILTRLLNKIKPVLPWLKQPLQAGASLGERIQAALNAWRERSRKTAKEDISHTLPAQAYGGSRSRQYLVHIPRANTGQQPRPLVVVLHGCRQDNRDIEAISGFNQLSDRHGFLVAYPFVTGYRGLRALNCWGWWVKREIQAGAGEVEDLWQIVEEIKRNYHIDTQRIHVTGLSSGAGMAVAMMVAHGDKVASGAAVAGVPYSERPQAVRHMFNPFPRYKPLSSIVSAMKAEMGDLARTVPLQIIHSKDDQTVGIQSAKNLRDSWGRCFGINTQESYNVSNGSVGSTDWEHRKYRKDDDQSFIETMFLSGPGHGWYGGNPGNYSYPEAPDISKYIWKFFDSHPLAVSN